MGRAICSIAIPAPVRLLSVSKTKPAYLKMASNDKLRAHETSNTYFAAFFFSARMNL